MALITCRECEKQVSSEAKQCPNCGAKVIPHKLPKTKTSAENIGKLVAAGFALLIILGMIGEYRKSQMTPEERKLADAKKAAYQQQQAEQALSREKKTQREDRAADVAAAIRKSSRNPDNVGWDQILTNEDGTVVCIAVRLENAFGGMNREHIAATDGKYSNEDKFWRQHCANQSMYDVTRVVSKMQQYY